MLPDDAYQAARTVAAVLDETGDLTDRHGRFPLEGIEQLRRSGLLGLLVPKEYGGLGQSCDALVEIAEMLAAKCLSTAMIWVMHCQQVASIVNHASPAMRERVLPRVASGHILIASITTEEGKGGHLLSAVAPLSVSDDSFLVRREAPVVTAGSQSDAFLITMRSDETSAQNNVTLVYADKHQVNVEARLGWDALGMRGTESGGIYLDGVIPSDQLINGIGGFRRVAIETLIPVGHIGWAAAWTGAAAGVFRQLISVLRDPDAREGVPLQSDLMAARIAQARLKLDTVSGYLKIATGEYQRLVSSDVAQLYTNEFQLHINTLKVFASESLFEAVDEMMRIAGLRYGYLRNGRIPIERVFRDLRAASLMYSNDRLLIANGKLSLLDTGVGLA